MFGPLSVFLAIAGIAAAAGPEVASPTEPNRPTGALRRPIAFEANTDLTRANVRYIAKAAGFELRLTRNSMVVAGGRDAITLSFAGAASNPRIIPIDRLPGGTNHLLGNDPAKWRTAVPSFGKVRYDGLYPGIDLVVYANDRELEYDLVVQPGVDPSAVRLAVDGARNLKLKDGDLVGRGASGEIRLRRPVAFQATGSGRRVIDARYRVSRRGIVTFEIGEYDRTKPLVIDPVIVYASFFGGSGDESSVSSQMVAVDATGAAYLTGGVGGAAFVTKIGPDGASIVYTTWLSGSLPNGKNAGTDSKGHAITVDAAGNAYVAGGTLARDFPLTAGTFGNPPHLVNQATMFLAKLAPNGTLDFSALWGTDTYDFSADVALDAAGNIFVAGRTCSGPEAFPVTLGAAQPTTSCTPSTFRHPSTDAFVVKFNPAASAVLYGTYLGGGGIDWANGLAVDSTGAVFVTGRTTSENFPLASPVQATRQGESDAFVAKVSPNGSQFVFSTYLGGNTDDLGRFGTTAPNAVAVDGAGSAYVSGTTEADGLPVTAGAFRTDRPPHSAVYVAKFSPVGSVDYLTYVSSGVATGIAVDGAGRAHVVGSTGFPNVPVTADAAQSTLGGSDDAFLTVLSADGTAVEYSTYLGGPPLDYANGVAIGTNGSVYVAGQTLGAGGFPTTSGAFQPSYGGGGSDFFIVRIQFTVPDTTAPSIGDVADITVETDSTAGAVVTFALPAVADDTDPAPSIEASPASGSTFPVGSTTVTVTATDASGNASEKTFTVNVVLSPSAMIASLMSDSASFKQGGNLLRNAQQNVAAGNAGAACNQLSAFVNQVKAQRGKSVAAAQADAWIASAMSIRSALGCR